MRRAAALALPLFLLSGCDLLQGLQNRKVLAAAVVATPEVAPTQVPGYAQGFPRVPGQVTAQLYFAERQDDILSGGSNQAAPVGIADAVVTLRYNDAAGVEQTLAMKAGTTAGQYEAAEADGLAYVAGSSYRFTVVSGGETYGATVVAPPPSHMKEFPATRFLAAGYAAFTEQTITFDRAGSDLAFYGVYRLHPEHPEASLDDVTCSNLPIGARTDVSQLVDLVLDSSQWQRNAYTLPKHSAVPELNCFPEAPPATQPAGYVVGLGIGRKGVVSDNLFSGSTAFAGSFDAGALVFTP